MFARVIVVEPTVNVFQVYPSSVEYSRSTVVPPLMFVIEIVEFAYSAVSLNEYPTVSL